MSCARFDELLALSVDRALEGSDREEFDAHLAACPACVGGLRGYVVTAQLLQGLGEREAFEPPPPLPETLVQRILAAVAADRSVRASRTA